MDRIFVQIASYRDSECQWTIKDMFAKARHPERVFAGICWQYDPEQDGDCFTVSERPEQVRIAPFHWQESEGVCWARHEAQQLWEGEEYVLSIDSHSRFAEHWDDALIAQLAECPSAKAILSNHPAAYTPPDKLKADAVPTVLRAHLFTPQGDLRIRGVDLTRAPENPLRGAFCAGGFIFAKSELISQVPYDPYLYFDQEEIALSARFFTHGFDVYSLKNILLYHYYRGAKEDKQVRLHWHDNPHWMRLQDRGRKRLNHLFGHTTSENPAIVAEIDTYGLGSERTLEAFEAFTGVNFKNRTVSDQGLRCGFIEDLSLYLDSCIHIPEIDDTAKKTVLALEPAAKPEAKRFDQPAAIERLQQTLPGGAKLDIDREAPEGLMIVYNYIDKKTCKMLTQYADSQSYTDLDVVDPNKSTKDKIVTLRNAGRVTHHVDIDGKALEIFTIFNDIYCNRMAAFYDVDFEWYERPQILRYPAGGKYDKHADADHWTAETDSWARVQDRDYSVLLYLNDEYDGGELELINQNFAIKPKPGMLLAFPSDHRYLHAARPTTSGLRYVIVSWSAIMGSKRVRPQMPYASVFVRQKRKA